MTSCHYDVTKVVILGIEYRSLSIIEVSSIDVIAGIVLTLNNTLTIFILYCIIHCIFIVLALFIFTFICIFICI